MIMLSFVADQRTDLQQEVNELKQTLASNDKGRKELIDSSKRLKDQLNQAVVSPPWPGRLLDPASSLLASLFNPAGRP